MGFFLFPALATARRTDKEPRWNQYIQCSPSAEVIGDAMANGEKNIAVMPRQVANIRLAIIVLRIVHQVMPNTGLMVC